MRERAAGQYHIPSAFEEVSTEALQFICTNAKEFLGDKLNDINRLNEKSCTAFFTIIPVTLAVGGIGTYLALHPNNNDLLILLSFITTLALLASLGQLYLIVVARAVASSHEPARYFEYKSFMRSRDAHRRYLKKEIEIVQGEITLTLKEYKTRLRIFTNSLNWIIGMLIANFTFTIFYFWVI